MTGWNNSLKSIICWQTVLQIILWNSSEFERLNETALKKQFPSVKIYFSNLGVVIFVVECCMSAEFSKQMYETFNIWQRSCFTFEFKGQKLNWNCFRLINITSWFWSHLLSVSSSYITSFFFNFFLNLHTKILEQMPTPHFTCDGIKYHGNEQS